MRRLGALSLTLLLSLSLAACQRTATDDEITDQPEASVEEDDTGTRVYQPGEGEQGTEDYPLADDALPLTGSAVTIDLPEMMVQPMQTGLLMKLEADRTEVHPGDAVRFTLTLTNASTASITNLTAEATFLTNQLTVTETGGASYADDKLRWDIPLLAAQESRSLKYTATIADTLRHGDVVLTILTASSPAMVATVSQTSAINVIERLPKTGAETRFTDPVEDTSRFVKPYRP